METRAPQAFVPVAMTPEPKVRQGAAPTELPKPKSVNETEEADKSANARENSQREEDRATEERLAAIDLMSRTEVRTHEATGSLVLQTKDNSTDEVISQFPNNATLKQRAIAKYAAVQGAPAIKRTI